tara:strand:+ start:1744 stop:4554 length:2811 start_codon:yes stop_codon:yes gene_type:complete
MDDLINEFLVETRESLDILDQDIIKLEQNPNDQALLGNIFRVVHTVKGTCGFLGLSRLEKVAHHAENVFGLYRDGVLEVQSDSVTIILESLDRIKEIVDLIEQTGGEGDGDDSELIAKLDAIEKAASGEEPEEDDIFTPVPASQTAAVADALGLSESSQQKAEDEDDEGEDGDDDEDEVKAVAPPAPKAVAKSQEPQAKKEQVAVTQSLRVNVDVLEDLMTMVSELVLTRNQLLQILRNQRESEFTAPLQRLNHVVSDLQEGVMKTRMQPIGNAWSKLPRIIRDLSNELGKKIDLEMRGQDTELDRQVLDLIKDPLTHMVRNSADHGIEDPADRLAVGKPETGTVLLNAYHEGGHIIIQISDDGKGLSTEKIKKKMIENGAATESQLAEMSESQIQQFIFHAGFSTAEKVTAVSGRGVGMDVVRTNIEKIGGTIDLKSKEGQGSTFTIKIPLTLAIVSALIVEAGEEKYAIPQLSVQELVRASNQGDQRIEFIKGTPVLRLRDRLLPLISLNKMLKLDQRKLKKKIVEDKKSIEEHNQDLKNEIASLENEKQPAVKEDLKSLTNSMEDDGKYIVVTQVGTYTFGIIVNKVFDTEEIVVKPVAPILRHIDLFAGNTILGDGSVIMILDPNGIANASGDLSVSDASEKTALEQASSAENKKTSLLVFRAGEGAPKAVPLSLVARLEVFEDKDIEISNNNHVIQYRGQLMPLVPFNNQVQVKVEGKERAAIVFSDHLRSMGLVVDEIVDIVEEYVAIETSTAQDSTFGSAIINGKATDIINVSHYLSRGHKDWFAINETDDPFENDLSKRVLLVDDSPFFRNMLVPLLSIGGYAVTAVESPLEALDLFEKDRKFDLIISDIEMPEMTGFDFAQKVRHSKQPWAKIPMIALSSHATEEDFERGRSVGFDDYVAKFDKDEIMDAVKQVLKKTQYSNEKVEV